MDVWHAQRQITVPVWNFPGLPTNQHSPSINTWQARLDNIRVPQMVQYIPLNIIKGIQHIGVRFMWLVYVVVLASWSLLLMVGCSFLLLLNTHLHRGASQTCYSCGLWNVENVAGLEHNAS